MSDSPTPAIRPRFRCARCDAAPDHDTERVLQAQLRDRRCGAFLDAQPGGWLIWTAGGPLGPQRYACAEHRDELVADLRRHYASVHPGVRDPGPYPQLWPNGFSALDEQELATLLAEGAFRRG